MALTGEDLRYLHRNVGSSPADAELQTIYDAYFSDGYTPYTLDWVILDVLERRLADLVAAPTSFSVAGEYSQSTSSNLQPLRDQIAAHRAYMVGLGIELPATVDGLTIQPATPPLYHR